MENRKDKLRAFIEELWEKEIPDVIKRDLRIKIESALILINDIIGPRRAGKYRRQRRD